MVKLWLKNKVQEIYPSVDFDVLIPPNEKMGDYSVNLAFILAKKEKKNPADVNRGVIEKFNNDEEFKKYFKKIETAGGYINFYLSDDYIRKQLVEINRDENFGYNNTLKGKKVVVEYTDPNPFKLFHIGHLMSNTVGEAIAKLYEASGAKVIRVNYQGDVGLHVAKTIWGLKQKKAVPWGTNDLASEVKLLGEAYALGSNAYENQSETKKEIEELNRKIYERSDEEINDIYDLTRKFSLEYFDEIYKKLGTKFNKLFFESEAGPDGVKIVRENMPKVFGESDGAVVFNGEQYGLHTRVFINSQGLPTYESKELGLNKKKFEMYSPDLSVIVTGNEINDYFKVLLKAMELTMPEVAKITKHIGHGMMRFASGKMSSRTGDVVTAESLIEQITGKIKEKETENSSKKTDKEYESLAVSAIKYMVLKHNIGSDIVFDFDRAVSVEGDAAPYFQYTYARLRGIIYKSRMIPPLRLYGKRFYLLPKFLDGYLIRLFSKLIDRSKLTLEEDFKIMKKIMKFPDVILGSTELSTLNSLCLYLYELSSMANHYYETVTRLSEIKFRPERNARLLLVETVASVLKRGLNLLGIETLERI